MYVYALHAVRALPDLRIAAGRFAGRPERPRDISGLRFLGPPCH
jgi:hypothetical protein